jgi:aspartate-semialdehyde dehydrogenase
MINETRKILHEPKMLISATCVRVPVFYAHSEAIHIEFENPFDPEDAKAILGNFPGIVVYDDPQNNQYPMPITAVNKNEVFVGRIRKDISCKNGLALWVVSDNLRKGAALNAMQIAEHMIKMDLIK